MIQDFGLALLVRQDNIKRSEQAANDIRLADVASGRRTVQEIFPEYFPALAKVSVDEIPEDNYFPPDDEAAAYDYSQAELDMSAAAREIESLADALADDRVTVSGSQDGWV